MGSVIALAVDGSDVEWAGMPTLSRFPSNLKDVVIGILVVPSDDRRGCLGRKVYEGQRRAFLRARKAMSWLEVATAVPAELLNMVSGILVVEPYVPGAVIYPANNTEPTIWSCDPVANRTTFASANREARNLVVMCNIVCA